MFLTQIEDGVKHPEDAGLGVGAEADHGPVVLSPALLPHVDRQHHGDHREVPRPDPWIETKANIFKKRGFFHHIFFVLSPAMML